MTVIAPLELKELLFDSQEIALIDVREQGAYSESHLLFAACLPLSRLELLIGDLVPRRDTRIVVVSASAADGLGARALLRGQRAQQGVRRVHRAHLWHAPSRGKRGQGDAR